MNIFITAWFARALGPERLGIYNYAFAFVTLLLPLVTLGLDEIVVRDVIRSPQTHNETLGAAWGLKFLGGFVLTAIVVAGVYALHSQEKETPILVWIFALGTWLKALDGVDLWFQAQVKSQYFVFPRLFSFLIFTGLRIAALKTQEKHDPLLLFALLWSAEYLVGSLGALVFYAQKTGSPFKWKVSPPRMKQLFAEAAPLLFSTILVSVYMRTDQVLLKWLSTTREVGIYSSAVKLIEATYFLPMVISASLFPSVVKSKSLGTEEYQSRIQWFFDLMIWLALIFALGFTFFSPWIVRLLLGPAFSQAAPILAIYSWMGMSIYFLLARMKWLAVEGNLKAAVHVEGFTVLFNLATNAVLIPHYGSHGAAIAALTSALAGNLVAATYSIPIRKSLQFYAVSLLLPVRIFRSLARSPA